MWDHSFAGAGDSPGGTVSCTSLHIYLHFLKHVFMTARVSQFLTERSILGHPPSTSPGLLPPDRPWEDDFLEERKIFPWRGSTTAPVHGCLPRYFYKVILLCSTVHIHCKEQRGHFQEMSAPIKPLWPLPLAVRHSLRTGQKDKIHASVALMHGHAVWPVFLLTLGGFSLLPSLDSGPAHRLDSLTSRRFQV